MDLSVRAGELLAVLGPNGVGKTTAISMLTAASLDGLERRLYGELSGGQQRRVQFAIAMAQFLPPYHLAQLALGVLGAGEGGSPLLHLGALVAFTAGFLVIAGWGYWRDEGRTYG